MTAIFLFMALLLLISAAHKFTAQDRMVKATAILTGSDMVMAKMLLPGVACAEIIAAIALLIPGLQILGAALAAFIWSSYSLALLRRHGQNLDCGCDLLERKKPVTWAQIARPALLAILAISGAVLIASGMETAWHIETPFAGLALLALYFGASELLANLHLATKPQHRHHSVAS